MKIKIVVIEKDINDLYENIDDEDFLEKINSNLIYVVNEKKDKIASIKISFIFKGIYYFFKSRSDWYIEYSYVLSQIEQHEEESDIERFGSGFSSSIEEIETYARQIADAEEFINSKNNSERRDFVFNYLDKKQIIDKIKANGILSDIIRRCQQIYNDEIKLKLDSELLLNVLELKAKGLKKVEIQSRLEISEKILNKFYYKDNTD